MIRGNVIYMAFLFLQGDVVFGEIEKSGAIMMV